MVKKYRKRRKHKKKQFTYNEKILFIVSIIITIVLSLLISIVTDSKTKFNHIIDKKKAAYTGSAVRKETHTRQNYEKYYRQKKDKWNTDYNNILNNKEEIKRLKKIELETTKKKNK